MIDECDCEEKIVLYKPKKAFEAIETWCPIHGYWNDCWMCDICKGLGTELCLRHRLEDKNR